MHGLVGVFVNIRSDGPQIRRIFGCQVDRKSDDKADEWDILRLGVLLMLNKVLPKMDQRVGKELNQELKQNIFLKDFHGTRNADFNKVFM